MRSEVIRLTVAMPLAVLVPALTPGVRERWPSRVMVALPFLALALLPGHPPTGAWGVSGGVLIVLAVIGDRGWAAAVLLATAAGIGAALFADSDRVGHVFDHVTADNGALIVLAGFVAATLVGGELVAQIAGRFAPADRAGIAGAGRTIGWLERAIVFALVVVAKPEAAALVIAAKSLARFPELSEDRAFAEYFLIGTLASVAIAAICAVATRGALGLSLDL